MTEKDFVVYMCPECGETVKHPTTTYMLPPTHQHVDDEGVIVYCELKKVFPMSNKT